MYRKELSKASQEWRWNDADQNDLFSDSSYLFPIQCILQNWVMIARADSILDLGRFNEGYLLLVGSSTVTFFRRTIALHDDAIIDCLIKWVQSAPAVDHSPALNHPGLPAGTQLAYLLFFYQFSLPSLLCFEQNFLFRPVSKMPKRGCQ